MSGPLDELIKRIMGSREGVLPSIQTFPPVDVEQVADELRLKPRAQLAGENEQPPADGTAEDLAELEIAAEMERRARKAAEVYRSQLNLYEGRIQNALLATDQGVHVEAAGQSALTDFKIQASDDLDQLHIVRNEVDGREREFEEFRKRHGLTRLPNLVSPNERRVRWLIVGILIVIESVLNGAYFREGSESGWIGGFWQAFSLALFNIGGAILYVRVGLPLLFHESRTLKVCGALVALLYLAWLLGVNLLIAHFRDLYIASNGNVSAEVIWTRLSQTPFSALVDSQSWILAALGIGLGIVALIDASGLRDPYWGYAAIGQRRVDAIAQYVNDKARCLAGLTERRDEAIVKMGSAIEAMRSWEFELRLAANSRSTLHQDFSASLTNLIESNQQLHRRYYEENIRSRKSPAPARFLRPIGRPVWAEPPILPDLPDLRESARKSTIERMERFIREINGQFETEAIKYESVRQITQTEHGDGRTS